MEVFQILELIYDRNYFFIFNLSPVIKSVLHSSDLAVNLWMKIMDLI